MADYSSTLDPLTDQQKFELVTQAIAQLELTLFGQTVIESYNSDGSENRVRIVQSGATYVSQTATTGRNLWVVRMTGELPDGWQSTGSPLWDLVSVPTP